MVVLDQAELVRCRRDDVARHRPLVLLERAGCRSQIDRECGADLADRLEQIDERRVVGGTSSCSLTGSARSAHHAPCFATAPGLPAGGTQEGNDVPLRSTRRLRAATILA